MIGKKIRLWFGVMGITIPLLALGGCGGGGLNPLANDKGASSKQASLLFPALATKNSTRLPGDTATINAALAARVVYPALRPVDRPSAVALIDSSNWQAAVAAAVLAHAPFNAALLLSDKDSIPEETKSALGALKPSGFQLGKGKHVPSFAAIRVGSVPVPDGLNSIAVDGSGPAALAAAIDRLAIRTTRKASRSILIVSGHSRSYALPAASWAAKSGTPVLFVGKSTIPQATRQALRLHKKVRIFVLGPKSVIANSTVKKLGRFGRTKRIAGATPATNAIAFARFRSFGFGWGIIDPGHGLVFINQQQPLSVAAAAALSASGTYGPCLLLNGGNRLPRPVREFLLDIQPGFRLDPVRGVYNHAWLVGDTSIISLSQQASIDRLVEIRKIKSAATARPTSTLPTQKTTTLQSPNQQAKK